MGVSSMLLTVALLLMGYMISVYMLQREEIRVVRNVIQQGLALTSLSAGVADKEHLADIGFEHIHFDEDRGEFVLQNFDDHIYEGKLLPQESYNTYRALLGVNVENCIKGFKDGSGTSRFSNLQIEKFLIYNVVGDEVLVYEGIGDNVALVETGNLQMGEIRTPDGEQVTVTSIYGEVSFSYRDLFGKQHKNLYMRQFSAVRFLAGGEK